MNPAQTQTCFCGCGSIEAQIHWVTTRWDVVGDPAVIPVAVPVHTEVPGDAGHPGSPRDGCAPVAGGQRGGHRLRGTKQDSK